MGVSGGGKVLKYLVFIFNFLFFLIGAALLGLGIYGKVGNNGYIDLTEDLSADTKFSSASNLLIAVGCIVFVVAFFGCCGAVTENSCMVLVFFVFLLIIFILELAVCILGYVKKDDVEKQLKNDFETAMLKKYSTDSNSAINKIIDTYQKKFKCCGYDSFIDWKESKYTNATNELPASCCKVHNSTVCPTTDANKLIEVYYTEGCFDKVVDWFKTNMYAFGSAAIAFAIVQVLGLVFSMLLYRSIKEAGEGMMA